MSTPRTQSTLTIPDAATDENVKVLLEHLSPVVVGRRHMADGAIIGLVWLDLLLDYSNRDT